MAVRALNSFLLVHLLIIISLAHFQQAQITYFPTEKVPSTWTNYFSPGYDQIILSIEKPNAEYGIGFAFGFYFQADGNSFYLAIGLAEALLDFNSGRQVWSFKNITWLSSRNRPVGENATLELLSDGNLVLKDRDESLVWSTNTTNNSIVGMKLMETGNLVLYNANNKTVWQSFDHPTDTLLPGQKLVVGKKLVASVSKTNPSEGNYYFSVTSRGLFGFYQADVPLMYFTTYYNGDVATGSVELKYDANGSLTLDMISANKETLPSYYDLRSPNNTTMSYLKLDPDGHLIFYNDNYHSYEPLEGYLQQCDYPASCGSYGLCTEGTCTCPAGFFQNNASNDQDNFGCSQINPVTCENPSSNLFLPDEDYYYSSYEAPVLTETDMESCKNECLKNCSCIIALFQYNDNASNGACLFPSPGLSLAKKEKSSFSSFSESFAFSKISNDGGSRKGSAAIPKAREPERSSPPPRKAIHSVIIAGSTIGAFLLMGLTFSFFWIVLFRKKRDKEEGMEDNLEDPSGIPVRFTYEALKLATEDFLKKAWSRKVWVSF